MRRFTSQKKKKNEKFYRYQRVKDISSMEIFYSITD